MDDYALTADGISCLFGVGTWFMGESYHNRQIIQEKKGMILTTVVIIKYSLVGRSKAKSTWQTEFTADPFSTFWST